MADSKFSKTVKVRHAGFTYLKPYSQILPSNGQLVSSWSSVVAMRDEEITLEFEGDYNRGMEAGAFYTDEHDPNTGVPLGFNPTTGEIEEENWPEADEDEITVDDASDEELIEFISKNNMENVLELADTKERAERLKVAEQGRTGGDPRKTLIAELDRRIEAANAAETEAQQ